MAEYHPQQQAAPYGSEPAFLGSVCSLSSCFLILFFYNCILAIDFTSFISFIWLRLHLSLLSFFLKGTMKENQFVLSQADIATPLQLKHCLSCFLIKIEVNRLTLHHMV